MASITRSTLLGLAGFVGAGVALSLIAGVLGFSYFGNKIAESLASSGIAIGIGYILQRERRTHELGRKLHVAIFSAYIIIAAVICEVIPRIVQGNEGPAYALITNSFVAYVIYRLAFAISFAGVVKNEATTERSAIDPKSYSAPVLEAASSSHQVRSAHIHRDHIRQSILNETELYGLVAKELAVNSKDEGLWTMAFALENGDEARTKAHYIRLRVKQLEAQPAQQAERPVAPISTITTESQSLVGDAPELKSTPSVKPSEFWLSQQAKRELDTGRVDKEILAKAKMFADGSEPQIAELYIRFRVNALLDGKQ